MHKQRYSNPVFLQNHPKQLEFPVKKLHIQEDYKTTSSLSMLLVGAFLITVIASIIMLIFWGILKFTDLLEWEILSFYTIAKPIWWAALISFILLFIQVAIRPDQAVKEQKRYYKLTNTTWLPREKREGLRLDLFPIYDDAFWSETLEYFPLKSRIEAIDPKALSHFKVLKLAKTETYINHLKEWWDVTNASSLKFTLEKLLKGLHAPEFANSAHHYPYLLQGLAKQTGFSLTGIEQTLQPQGDYPPELLWGFDLSRAVSVARHGYMAQYLTEEEAWHYILRAKDKAYEIFQSEQDFFNNYLLGYAYWQSNAELIKEQVTALHRYQSECDWPMKRLRWNHRYYLKPDALSHAIANTKSTHISDLVR